MRPSAIPRPSMADVGRRAQVSAQTVSRYFSGDGYVSEATRSRIAEAVRELGYVPNRAAGALRGRRTDTLGVLTVGELNYGSAQILTGLSRAARELGQTLLIAEVDTDFEALGWQDEVRRTIDHFLSAPVDGLVVSTAIPEVEDELDRARSRIPVVNLSRRPGPSGDVEATGEAATVGLEATQHLLDLGHEEIVHVAGPRTRGEAAGRELGYRMAMEQAGLESRVLGGASDWWAPSGAAAIEQLEKIDFTGVFAANDELALGVMSALGRRGVTSPRDYSIIGVDDMPSAAYFSPSLTTMHVDFAAIGRHALHRLHHRIENREELAWEIIGPELVVRESTGAPAPRRAAET